MFRRILRPIEIVLQFLLLVPALLRLQVLIRLEHLSLLALVQAKLLQVWRLGDGYQELVVVGTGEEENTDAELLSLVLRGRHDTMNGCFEEATGEEFERLADVDDESVRDVLPNLGVSFKMTVQDA